MSPFESYFEDRAQADQAALLDFRRLVVEASHRFLVDPPGLPDPECDLDQSAFWAEQAAGSRSAPLLNALCRANQAYWMAHAALGVEAVRLRVDEAPFDARLNGFHDVDPLTARALAARWRDTDTSRLHADAAVTIESALRDCRDRDTPPAELALELIEQARDDLEDWRHAGIPVFDEPEEPLPELRPEVSDAVDLMLRRCFVTAVVDQVSRRDGLGTVSAERDAANNIELLKRETVAPSEAELAFNAARAGHPREV